MASSSTDLGVNEHHEEIIRHYVRFSREQKTVGLHSFRAAAIDFKNQRLSDESMMTVNEVNDFLDEFIDILEKEFEQELTHQYRINALLIKQLFQQAEQWFLKLNPNFDQLENRRLIDLIRDYEQQELHTMKSKGKKDLLDPINDTKSTMLLKTEIQRLQQINDQLKHRLLKYEKDDELLNQQLEENMRLFGTKEATYSQQLEYNEKRLKDIQQALLLAENELEKKFNQTNTYLNMKKMIDQKNQQIRFLRQQLSGNNNQRNDEGEEEED
jgi:leucine zipper transcription factor-like protein 1